MKKKHLGLTSISIKKMTVMYKRVKRFIKKIRLAIYNGAQKHDITIVTSNDVKKTIIRQRYEHLALTSNELGISDELYDNNKLLIVSITTYGARAMTTYLSIESIMHQTLKPNKIILFLDQNEFTEKNLPLSIKRLQTRGLEIIYTEDTKSYKKLIPALKEYSEDIIITIDDDVIYPPDIIERLYRQHINYPKDVICCHAHVISFDNEGNTIPYLNWPDVPSGTGGRSRSFLPVGIGGILYPPHCLSQEVFNQEMISRLSPTADDLWFKIMAILNGVNCVKVPIPEGFDDWITTTNSPFDKSLSDTNSTYANDIQWRNLLSAYNLDMYDFDAIANAERFLPEQAEWNTEQWVLFQKHLFAYKLAKEYLKKGSKVLEIGCGDGYGANYLAGNDINVIGIDVDKHSINYAQRKYKNNKLSFNLYNGESINYEPHSFDMVISFQVMEHVEKINQYLENIKKMLKPNGLFLITTPNRTYRLCPGQPPDNPYHLREYDSNTLKETITSILPDAKIYGITAEEEVLNIEKERCRSSRQDYNPKEFHYVPHRANYREVFSTESFRVISEEIDNGLDLLATNIEIN